MRTKRLLLFFWCATAASCTAPNPDYCDADAPCADPDAPFCDEDGAVAGATNTCIPTPAGSGDGSSGDGDTTGDDGVPGPSSLTVAVEGTGSGVVFSSPNGIECGNVCTFEFEPGTEVTLTAAPESGVSFVTWGEACAPGPGDCRVTVDGPTDVTARFEPRGKHLFSRSLGGSDDLTIGDIELLGERDFVVAGVFSGTHDFGDGVDRVADNADTFVARYEGSELKWVEIFEGATTVALARHGDTIVAAVGAVDAAGGSTMRVARFSVGGDRLWTREIRAMNGAVYATSLGASGGAIAVAGAFSGVVDFGDGARGRANGGQSGFLLKLSDAGSFRWVRVIQSTTNLDPNSDYLTGVSVAEDGRVAFSAAVSGADLDIGTGPLPGLGSVDILLGVFDPNGRPIWARRLGGEAVNVPADVVAVDDSLIVTGLTEGPFDLGEGPRANLGLYVFVGRYGLNDGDVEWLRDFEDKGGNGLAATQLGRLDISERGEVVVTGAFGGEINFGGARLFADGFKDFFVASLSANDGTHRYSTSFGAAGDLEADADAAPAVSLDGVGRVAIAGSHTRAFSLGSSPLVPPGGSNGFVGIFAP